MRLKELAAVRVRYGYRRLTILLRREGWQVGKRRIYRLYRQENLLVRMKTRRKRVARIRVPLQGAERPNQRWSMDFMSDRLMDGRAFRVLTISMGRKHHKLAAAMKQISGSGTGCA